MKIWNKNIAIAIKHSHLNKAELALEMGVAAPTVTDWTTGKIKDMKAENAEKVCRILGISLSWLLYDKAPMYLKDLPLEDLASNITKGPEISKNKIPLISFVTAGELCEAEDPYPLGMAEEWLLASIDVTKGMYALKVVGDSMRNPYSDISFPSGTIIIIDPYAQPENGSLVIAKVGPEGKSTFKKLSYDGDEVYLCPLNPDMKPRKVDGSLSVCGVVVGSQRDLRKLRW